MVQLFWKTVEVFLKLKIDIFDPAVVLLGTYYREMRMYLSVEIHVSLKLETTKSSFNR